MANTKITADNITDGAITSAKLDTNIAVGGTLNVSGAFTSLGIDDNATSTAITIDSSEKVAIGSTVTNKLFNLADPAQGGETLKLHFEADSALDSWGIYAYDRTNSHYADMYFGQNAIAIKGSNSNVGIGDTNPRTQTTIVGAGQTTADITDAGNQGGTLTLGQNSDAFNSGGALLFASLNDGGAYTPQAAIKSLLQNGGGQGIGHLAFSMRAATGDTALAERLRILNDGGITFNGETAAANALNAYEEGTFTPTVTATSGTLTLNSSYNLLGYTKIGRVVTITGMIVIGSVSSPSGTLVIGDLPFIMFNDSVFASQTRPSIHLYAGGSGAPNAGYYSAFIGFNEGTRAGSLVITYNSTYDDTCADWMSVGSDFFINFSYHTA